MYDRVLLPTDGSEASLAAGEHAFDIASTYGAELHTVFAVDETVFAADAYSGTTPDQYEQVGEEAVVEVAERASGRGLGTVTREVVYGPPHQAIADYAGETDADLVVMGTHGRSGVERYLLGSVTEKVVRTADVPVLTVRPGE